MKIETQLHREFNRCLDRLVHPAFRVHHKPWPAFRVCGYVGLALAILLTMALVVHRGRSPWIMAALVLASVSTFLGLAMATKVLTGEESLTYYHHQIAVMTVTAFLLWLLCQPILPYLDVTILGVGLFLACGRVGCLMVGCCHGRPHRWGVCYRAEHAAAGFPRYLVGVRLFPIQAVESAWVFSIVLVGTVLILSSHPPGEALAWYVIAYNLGRFCFEFLRGDAARPYFRGFSEAQWTSLLLMCVVVWAEWSGRLPFQPWHAGATVLLVLTIIAIASKRRFGKTPRHRLLHPRHVKEVAEAVETVSNSAIARTIVPDQMPPRQNIPIGCTSLGVQISAGKIERAAGCTRHYTLSYQSGIMTREAARTLAGLILQLERPGGSAKFVNGNRGVFHLVVVVTC